MAGKKREAGGAVAEPGFHGFVFQVQKISDAYAIVIRDKTSTKLILVHCSSGIYNF